MTRTRADSSNSSDPDSEPHHPDADADALARLERLLEAQLAPDPSTLYTPPEDTGAPPVKKKKLNNEAAATETRPDEAAQAGQSAEVGQSADLLTLRANMSRDTKVTPYPSQLSASLARRSNRNGSSSAPNPPLPPSSSIPASGPSRFIIREYRVNSDPPFFAPTT